MHLPAVRVGPRTRVKVLGALGADHRATLEPGIDSSVGVDVFTGILLKGNIRKTF